MTACAKCGEDVPEPARFCGACGMSTTGSSVVLGADADPLAKTAPADPKEIAKFRLAIDAARESARPVRSHVAPTVNDLVMVPEPGAKVQVEWSDGKKYPATVKQSSAEKCLVLFPDGQEQWVELRQVSPA